MKKKLLWTVGVVLVLAMLVTLVGPSIILSAVRQPEVEESYAYSESFYNSYEEIRAHLGELTKKLGVEISSYAVDEADGLYIDSFYLPSSGDETNLVVLTTGVHGMEGYIGATMLDVFFQEVYPTLDPANTGVLVVSTQALVGEVYGTPIT